MHFQSNSSPRHSCGGYWGRFNYWHTPGLCLSVLEAVRNWTNYLHAPLLEWKFCLCSFSYFLHVPLDRSQLHKVCRKMEQAFQGRVGAVGSTGSMAALCLGLIGQDALENLQLRSVGDAEQLQFVVPGAGRCRVQVGTLGWRQGPPSILGNSWERSLLAWRGPLTCHGGNIAMDAWLKHNLFSFFIPVSSQPSEVRCDWEKLVLPIADWESRQEWRCAFCFEGQWLPARFPSQIHSWPCPNALSWVTLTALLWIGLCTRALGVVFWLETEPAVLLAAKTQIQTWGVQSWREAAYIPAALSLFSMLLLLSEP